MPETVAYLGLGANQGERAANLRRAVALLEEHPRVKVEARSRLYASQSVEEGGPNDFLNGALRVRTGLSAHELLELCQSIEAVLGRPAPPRRGARTLDIDILLWGDARFDTPDLSVPHPRALSRAFVLRPLLDVLQGGWVEAAPESW